MSLQNHLAELERRHEALEQQIAMEVLTPSGDDLKIAELKKKKLHLKDEIRKLRDECASPTLH